MTTNPFKKTFDRMLETFAEYQWKSILRSYCLVMRDERKARLHAVMELSVELEKIKKESIFSTGLAEGAMESVIEGDWMKASEYIEYFMFPDHCEETKIKHIPLWANFRLILQTACTEARHRETTMKSPGN